jgi:septal ring factor EnvC (AmiA/AmiB activator)
LFEFVANANSDIENLQEEIVKKTDENLKQQDEIMCLSYEMREIHRRLKELKKENEELKVLLSFTGKTRHEYETKVNLLLANHFQSIFLQFRLMI